MGKKNSKCKDMAKKNIYALAHTIKMINFHAIRLVILFIHSRVNRCQAAVNQSKVVFKFKT